MQNMLRHANILIVFLSILEFGTGLYFHIGETERKCFIEEIPDDTTVLGKNSMPTIMSTSSNYCY